MNNTAIGTGGVRFDPAALWAQARASRAASYSPYSHVRVGAALLAADGRVFCGANIENASFSVTLCAERAAFACALSAGARDFTAIAVAGGGGDAPEDEFPPCGMCLQFMQEFCTGDFAVVLSPDRVTTLSQLLPRAFDGSKLPD